MPKKQINTGIVITLLIFLSLGLAYSYYTPLWNPPDEERHFAYCEYIAQNHKLPAYQPDSQENIVGMAFHPPLYYLIGSIFCKDDKKLLEEELTVNEGPGFIQIIHPKDETAFPYSGKARSAHVLRLLSLSLSTLTLLLIYLLVMNIFPGERILASSTTLFVATIPQFLHGAVSVSNDTLAILLSTAYLLSLIHYIKDPFKLSRQIICGLLLGLCLLAKLFTLCYLPVTACIITGACLKEKKKLIAHLFVIFAVATLVAGWWYLKNWLISNDPFLAKTVLTFYPWFMRHIPLSPGDVGGMLVRTFVSFFGYFGAMQFSIHPYHLITYGCVMLLGAAGWLRLRTRNTITAFQRKALGVLVITLLGGLGFFILLNINYVGSAMGRYLFVVIAPIAILTFTGIFLLVPPQWKNSFMMALSCLLLIMNLSTLFRVLKPAYAEPSLSVGAHQPLFSHPTPGINSATTISQSFISSHNNLSGLQVLFSNLNKTKRGEITFSLTERRNTGAVLRRSTLPVREITDNNRYFFSFPPIMDSSAKEYLLSISAPSLSGETDISLWYESHNAYPDGTIFINGEPAFGDLFFTAYHFTGEQPETMWQGTREQVIKQGLYISIRELQLYHERSKVFREKTTTHEKTLLFQKALKNRKAVINKRNHA